MSFAHALSDKLRTLEDEDVHVEEGYWYPTQLGFCNRAAILQHASLKGNPHDDITLRRFFMGNVVHKAIQESHPWKVIGSELRVRNEEYKVSGKIDTLSVTPDGILEVQEYKSINSRSFSYSDLPKREHILQLAVYLIWQANCNQCVAVVDGAEITNTFCGLCNTTRKIPLPQRGRLVYISKDDLRIEEFIVTLTPELEEEVKSKFLLLEAQYQQYLKDGTLPPALPLVEKKSRAKTGGVTLEQAWQTRYCSFAGTGKCCGDTVSETEPERNDSPEGTLPEGG